MMMCVYAKRYDQIIYGYCTDWPEDDTFYAAATLFWTPFWKLEGG